MMPANRTARPEVFDGVADRRGHVAPGDQALAVAGHDEQGVVDAHPQADQQDQLRRELGHLEDVAEQADHADGGPQRGQGRHQGQDHGEDRAEDQEQHDGRPGSRPSPVPPNDCRSAASATWPATATWRFGPAAVWAVATNVLGHRRWRCTGPARRR